MIGSASVAAAASGIAAALSISLFAVLAVLFAACLFLDTSRLIRFLPPLYFLGSIQWIPAAAQPTGTIFWICFAIFIVSGISALMLFPVADCHVKNTPGDASAVTYNAEISKVTFRAFSIAVAGITAAVISAAIPLFFLFPRLPAKSGAPPPSGTAASYADLFDDIETIELGRSGPPRQPETIVMRVKTDAPKENVLYGLKWRGISYDHYDGRAWTLRRREQLPIATQGRFYKLEESALGAELMRQTFFMEETLTNTVFAAHRALAVSAGAGFLRRDSSDNLFTQYPAHGKTGYTVVSDAILPDAGKISDWFAIPDDIRSAWLQLPEIDPRIARLANDITRGYTRQYDKAIAIETWLGSNYAYTSTMPEIYEVSESGDPLAVFLFDTREGHCEYFATAMTVMLRAIGIPARMTIGFLAGEYNPIGGSWTVRRKHSHLWTEAWFPPYGWIEFDATPAEEFSVEPTRAGFLTNLSDAAGLWWRENVSGYDASRQYSVISGFFTRVNQAEDRAGEFLSSSARRARSGFHLPPPVAAAAKITALIVLFIAVFGIIILLRTKRRITGVFRLHKQNPQAAAVFFYEEALIFLKARGFILEKAQTPMEFAKSLGAHPAADALFDLTRLYNEARFGDPGVPFPRDEARALWRSLKNAFGNTGRCLNSRAG